MPTPSFFIYILQYNNLNLDPWLHFGSWFLILCVVASQINDSHSFVMYGPLNFPDCSNFSKFRGLFQMCRECWEIKEFTGLGANQTHAKLLRKTTNSQLVASTQVVNLIYWITEWSNKHWNCKLKQHLRAMCLREQSDDFQECLSTIYRFYAHYGSFICILFCNILNST